MNYDIRVVEDVATGIAQVSHVTYGDHGEVIGVMQIGRAHV